MARTNSKQNVCSRFFIGGGLLLEKRRARMRKACSVHHNPSSPLAHYQVCLKLWMCFHALSLIYQHRVVINSAGLYTNLTFLLRFLQQPYVSCLSGTQLPASALGLRSEQRLELRLRYVA